MTDGVGFELTGLDELRGKLSELSDDVQFRGGRFALRKAAQVIRDQVASNAERVDDQSTPESIQKNIALRWDGRMYRATGDLAFRVGVLGGSKSVAKAVGEIAAADSGNPGGDTFHWRFLEFGTQKMAARPFVRPAADQAAGNAVNEFVRQYNKAVDRALRRARKK